ncbi:hypothetical protein LTR32_005695 [Rachicladosporium monterosium]|uniref:Uncharacterized protein n=1 Tax=Rachicladosporium monterosium TaxID=1507873 RepID=A0ABR0L117_9PEZI|nr:hypothetical protein LTR32_005695 [Rachicladosporium monterosium]
MARGAHRNYTKKPFTKLLINEFFVSKVFIAAAKAWAGNQDFTKGIDFSHSSKGGMQGIVPAFAKTITTDRWRLYLVATAVVNLRSLTLCVDEFEFACIEDEVLAWEDQLANNLLTAGVKTTTAWQCNVANLGTYARNRYILGRAEGSTRNRICDAISSSKRHRIYHNSAVTFNTANERSPDTSKAVSPPGDGASSPHCGALLPTTTESSKEKPVFGKKSAHIDHHQPSSPLSDSLGQAQLLAQKTDGKRKLPKAVTGLGKKQERTSDAPVPSVASNSAVLLTQSGYHSRVSSLPSSKPPAFQLSPNPDIPTPHGTSSKTGTPRISGAKGTSTLVGAPGSNNGHGKAVQKDGSRSIDHNCKGGLADPAQQRARVVGKSRILETVEGLTVLFARSGLG